MSGERRQYSPQCKLQVVLELLKGQKSAAQIAREHNIGQDLLSRWRDLFHERGAQIERVALEFPRYGYRRMTAELRRRGAAVNHKRVLRLLRADNLLVQVRRFCRTTN